MAGVKAEPLSYLWTIKEAIDHIRATTAEYDDQRVTDDNIKSYLQNALMSLHKLYPAFRYEYIIQIPFAVDHADPFGTASTVPSAAATNRMPYKIIHGAVADGQPTITTGIADFHYEAPVNFEVLGWANLWNSTTGTTRRTSDYAQLMGICLGNNIQLTKTVAWYTYGRNLWLSVRERMPDATRVFGLAIRTVIPLIELEKVTGDVPTGIADNYVDSDNDERYRYAPVQNDWAKLDCPDDYTTLVFNMASVKVWGQVGKTPQESVETQINSQLAQLTMAMERGQQASEQDIKANQWKDVGHL